MKRLPAPLQQIDRVYVRCGRRRLSYFSGCDYYRLASDPRVLGALEAGLKEFGLNVAASRLTTGNHALYEQLETELAQFFGAGSAVLLSNGYAANLSVAQALAGEFSHALIDERAHTSLVEAAQMLNCPVLRFQHRDAEDAARITRRIGTLTRPILLTDGMFAHDGSIAPLPAYLDFLPRDGMLLVDDAHAAGILGKTGKGTAEHLDISTSRIIRTVTLSKAFGVYGGAVLGPRTVRKRILERSSLFVGNTPLPLPLVSAALCALEILRTSPSLRNRLARNVRVVKERLVEAGFPVPENPSPIIPLVLRGEKEIARCRERLLGRRIFPPFIQYPGGPPLGYFRVALSSEHRREQLDSLVDVLLEYSTVAGTR